MPNKRIESARTARSTHKVLYTLFAVPGADIGGGAMGGLYKSLVVLLEEKPARLSFCAAWLGLDAALVWRLFFSKRGADDSGPIERLGD